MLKDLAGDGSGREDPDEEIVWTARPLLARRGDRWELTDYGVALAAYHDEQDASPAEVLFLSGGVSEAVLAAAADELLEVDEHA